eukprot:gene27981-28285_t
MSDDGDRMQGDNEGGSVSGGRGTSVITRIQPKVKKP